VLERLSLLLDEASTSLAVKAVIITGRGNRALSQLAVTSASRS